MKQERLWKERESEISAALKQSLEEPAPKSKASNEFGGATAKEQLENFLLQIFRKYGVCNTQFLKQLLTERQKDKSNPFLLLM